LHISCINSCEIEQLIINKFNNQFENVDTYGKEYFKGNLLEMIKTVLQSVSHSFDCLSSSNDYYKKLRRAIHNNTKLHNEIQELKKTKTLNNITKKQVVHDDISNTQNIRNERMCSKCKTVFSRKNVRKKHEENCNNLDKRQCSICLKVFSTIKGKWNHAKFVKCNLLEEPIPIPMTTPIPVHIINNINNGQTNIENQNNIQKTIHINTFGKESLSFLLQDDGIYGLPKILDEMHFKTPENNTILKPDEYDNTVLIKNENNEWEISEFEDVRDNMIDNIIKYIKIYTDVKNKLGVNII
jgi:hypothetical protein